MGEASKSYYSNKVSLVFAQFDLRLAFFEINPCNTESPETELCTVVMSPHHFKALVNVLHANLASYERVFGEINTNINQQALSEVAATNAPDKKEEG